MCPSAKIVAFLGYGERRETGEQSSVVNPIVTVASVLAFFLFVGPKTSPCAFEVLLQMCSINYVLYADKYADAPYGDRAECRLTIPALAMVTLR